MKNILHIENPKIRYSQDYAFPSAIMSSDQSYMNWIYSNMIQLYYIAERNTFNISYFYLGRDPNPLAYIPLLTYQQIHKQLLRNCGGNAIKFLHCMIDEGYYIACLMDEYYIPSRELYKKAHFYHGVMIYGYDDENDFVYIAGYNKDKQFGYQVLPYAAFKKAFWNVKREDDFISCFRRNEKNYELDTILIKELLHDYIYSLNTSIRCRMVQNPLKGCYWGIDAGRHILGKQDEQMDLRYFYTFYEHMKLMNERCAILGKMYGSVRSELKCRMSELEKKYHLLLLLCIKYNQKRDEDDYRKIENKLKLILDEEKSVLSALYDCLF